MKAPEVPATTPTYLEAPTVARPMTSRSVEMQPRQLVAERRSAIGAGSVRTGGRDCVRPDLDRDGAQRTPGQGEARRSGAAGQTRAECCRSRPVVVPLDRLSTLSAGRTRVFRTAGESRIADGRCESQIAD